MIESNNFSAMCIGSLLMLTFDLKANKARVALVLRYLSAVLKEQFFLWTGIPKYLLFGIFQGYSIDGKGAIDFLVSS